MKQITERGAQAPASPLADMDKLEGEIERINRSPRLTEAAMSLCMVSRNVVRRAKLMRLGIAPPDKATSRTIEILSGRVAEVAATIRAGHKLEFPSRFAGQIWEAEKRPGWRI